MTLTETQKDMIAICKMNGGTPLESIVLISRLYKTKMQIEMIRWMLKNPGANSQQRYKQCLKIYTKHHTKQDQEEQDRYWAEMEAQDSKEE